jgi:DnaJ-class molecular chaperone
MKSKQTLAIAGLAITSSHVQHCRTDAITSSSSSSSSRTAATSPAAIAVMKNVPDGNTDSNRSDCPMDNLKQSWDQSALGHLSRLRGGGGDKEKEVEQDDKKEEQMTVDQRSNQESPPHKQEGGDHVEEQMDSSNSLNDGGSKRKKKKKKGKKVKNSSSSSGDKEGGLGDKVSTNKTRKETNHHSNDDDDNDDAKSTVQEKKHISSNSATSSSSSSDKIPKETHFSATYKNDANASSQNEPKTKHHHHHQHHHHQHHQQKQKQNDIIQEIIQSTDLYHILSLDKSKRSSLTSTQITKAYRRRAVLTHPDKLNGDRRAFDKVSEAYDILNDETKKKIYDRFGLDAVKDPDFAARYGSSAGSSMSSAFSSMSGSFHDHILRNFFGGVGGTTFGSSTTFGSGSSGSFSRGKSQSSSQYHARNHNVRYELEVSLEDMYRGSHADIPITQPNGSPRTVQVDIPPGIVPGSTIRLPGMVDHVRHATPGDIIFIIRQRAHDRFTRKGHDLAMEVNISLSEAINGFQKEIVHLDNRRIWIHSPKDEDTDVPLVIQTGDVHVLKGEGMPKRNNHRGNVSAWLDHEEEQQQENEVEANLQERCKHFGDLYIQYVVQMPNTQQSNIENLSMDERQTLAMLLDKLQGEVRTQEPSNTSLQNTKAMRKRQLHISKASDFGCASGIASPQRDDEDDFMHGEDDDVGDTGRNSHHHHRSRGFHQYFTAGGPGGPFFSRGSFPFTSSSTSYSSGTDEGDVQCQQM